MLCDHVVQYYSTTTKYYASTTPYCKVPLQYYKVLAQYYKVLLQKTQNTTTNTQTKNLKTPPQTHQAPFTPGTWATNRIKDIVEAVRKDIRQLTTQASQSAKTYVMPESHQVLSESLSDLLHVTNTTIAVRKDIVYCAWNNRCHDPTAANTAPVTQKDSRLSPHHI